MIRTRIALAILTALPLLAATFSPTAANAQANLTFNGGNNTPLTINFNNPITYTITTALGFSHGPIFLFVGAANTGPFIDVSSFGTVTFSINGGAAQTVYFARNDYTGGVQTKSDLEVSGLLTGVAVGDQVTLTSGMLTTGSAVSAAAPANGTFTTFIVDNYGNRASGNGNSPSAGGSIPEPASLTLLVPTFPLASLVLRRRRKAGHIGKNVDRNRLVFT